MSLPPTELRSSASTGLDSMTSLEMLELLNDNDAQAVMAARRTLPVMANLVDDAARCVRQGGTVHYFGAGTSGRLAFLDAAELLPTFNLSSGVVIPHVAGGLQALHTAVENAEDQADQGALEADELGATDVAIGITASGTTPYVKGALERAGQRGAVTALITCNPASPIADLVRHPIIADTGSEVLTGSTRLKAGTAQKILLNGFSTSLMVQLGRTWSNLMVDVVATNAKLRDRTIRILVTALGITRKEAERLLSESDGELKTAIVMARGCVDVDTARGLLKETEGAIRPALSHLHVDNTPHRE